MKIAAYEHSILVSDDETRYVSRKSFYVHFSFYICFFLQLKEGYNRGKGIFFFTLRKRRRLNIHFDGSFLGLQCVGGPIR